MVSAALLALLGAVRNVWQLCCTIFDVLISLIQMGEQLGSHHLEDNCCWSSFLSGRHSAAILLKGALLFSFLSLLPNEKNIEVQPEGLYYLCLIHFTVKSILFYFQNFREGMTNKFFWTYLNVVFFPTENINKCFFLFEEIPEPYQ